MKKVLTILSISITLSSWANNNGGLKNKDSAFNEKPQNIMSLLTNHNQRMHSNSYDMCVESHKLLVDAYYGLFSPYAIGLKNQYNTAGVTGFTKGGLGTIGLRVAFMFTDKIEAGLEANVSRTTLNWTSEDGGLYVLKGNKFNQMIRVNYHLITNEKFDSYIGGGVGAFTITENMTSVNRFTSDPDIQQGFAYRLALGGRYFVTDFNAITFEIGALGGAYIHVGIAAKLL